MGGIIGSGRGGDEEDGAPIVDGPLVQLFRDNDTEGAMKQLDAWLNTEPENDVYAMDVNCIILASWLGQTDAIRTFIERGVDPCHADDWGMTGLSYACCFGHRDAAELLLSCEGADVDERDFAEWTPLMKATQNGHEQVDRLVWTPERRQRQKQAWRHGAAHRLTATSGPC